MRRLDILSMFQAYQKDQGKKRPPIAETVARFKAERSKNKV